MIYCVVPTALADELLSKLTEHYGDDENVEVIVERRKFDRRARHGGRAAAGDARAARRARPPPRRVRRRPAASRWPTPSAPRLGRRASPSSAGRVKLVVHVDGGARGNPGPAAAAA